MNPRNVWSYTSTKQEHFILQTLGVGCLIFMGYVLTALRLSEPLSVIPALLIYLFLQAILRIGMIGSSRPRRVRNFLFIV